MVKFYQEYHVQNFSTNRLLLALDVTVYNHYVIYSQQTQMDTT